VTSLEGSRENQNTYFMSNTYFPKFTPFVLMC